MFHPSPSLLVSYILPSCSSSAHGQSSSPTSHLPSGCLRRLRLELCWRKHFATAASQVAHACCDGGPLAGCDSTFFSGRVTCQNLASMFGPDLVPISPHNDRGHRHHVFIFSFISPPRCTANQAPAACTGATLMGAAMATATATVAAAPLPPELSPELPRSGCRLVFRPALVPSRGP